MLTSFNPNFHAPLTSTESFINNDETVIEEKDKIGEKYKSIIKNITDPNGIDILSRMCRLFQNKLDNMLKRGCSAQEIRDAANNGLNELDRIADLFSTNTNTFHDQMDMLNDDFDAIDRNLNNRQFSMESFSVDDQPQLQNMLMSMPGYLEQREDMLELMSLVKGAAAATNFIHEGLQGVLNEFGSNVERHAHAICNKNPLIQKRCQQIKNLPSNLTTDINGVFDSAGRSIESKISAFCNKNSVNRKICNTALNFSKSFADAVQESEPQLKSGSLLQNIPNTRFSFDITQGTKTVDQIWNLKEGSSKAFLSNAAVLMLNINPSIKEGQLLGKTLKSFSPKGQGLTNAVSSLNNKQYKTLTTLFTAKKTTPPSWKQVEQLFVSLGCKVEERAGSRIAVMMKDKEQVFHVPHRHHETDKHVITKVRTFLKEIEAIPIEQGKLRF